MRKLLFLAFLAVSGLCVAQDSSSEFKPAGGEKSLELQFTPWGGAVFNINGIRGRVFQSSTQALRVTVNANYSSTSTVTQQEDTDLDLDELRDYDRNFYINIRPGIERHMSGTDRLSPYFGVEADLAFSTSRLVEESQDAPGANIVTTKTINDENSYFRIGANALAGFDFYVAKKLYLGGELGFGLSYRKDLAEKVKSDADGFTEPDPVKGGGSFGLGPNVNGAIRLGYIF